jgi:cytochrome c-type biogenesis protein CcmF
VTGNAGALLMFSFAAFVLGAVGQELHRGVRARRVMARESLPRAFVATVRRNRGRYGGYLIHAGVAVMFVGVAASSAFQEQRLVQLRVGQTEQVGDYAITYVKPSSRVVPAPNGRLERIDLGAELSVRRGDGKPETLTTYKSYFPSTDPSLGPISRFFEGESTSEVGLDAGLRRDLWTAVAPDIGRLLPRIEEGDEVFADADELTPEQRGAFLGEALRGLSTSYLDQPPPATFRIIASPLVTWIWLGALIVFGGGLIAMWPTGTRARKPADAVQLARVARELQRV